MNSKFIVIEGLEGAGKTTARDAIVATLRARGIHDLVLPVSLAERRWRNSCGCWLSRVLRASRSQIKRNC